MLVVTVFKMASLAFFTPRVMFNNTNWILIMLDILCSPIFVKLNT